MNLYTGEVVYIAGTPFGIAERVSPAVKIYSQDTGRWSQVGPPDAQKPVKMRPMTGYDPDYPQLGYDLSNAELRIVAELSQDEVFIASFSKGWDLHTITACDVLFLDRPPSLVKKDIHFGEICAEWRAKYAWQGEDDPRRKFGKIMGFRTLYGGTPEAAWKIPGANKLGIAKDKLTSGAYNWLTQHPKLVGFWDKNGGDAVKTYCIRDIYGRRRILTDSDEKSRYRQGINYPMQAFVADIIHEIVMDSFKAVEDRYGTPQIVGDSVSGEPLRLYGQMHDSLLWGIQQDIFAEAKEILLEVAQRPRTYKNFTFQFPVSHYTKGV